MDRQNRVGSKIGAGGIASKEQQNVERKKRLKKLAFETIDLAKDPYLMRNHLGSYECKLCLTLHSNEGSYLSHVQGKKHQQGLARRMAKEVTYLKNNINKNKLNVRENKLKIGKPGYKITNLHNEENNKEGLLFQLFYPLEGLDSIENLESVGTEEPLENEGNVNNWKELNKKINKEPCFRFMSSFEQKIEPPNKDYQYIIFGLYPFENIAFKISSNLIDRNSKYFWNYWDQKNGIFYLQLMYK